MSLSKSELILISKLLEMAAGEFSNHGCNDFKLENNEDNKQILLSMEVWNGDCNEKDLEKIMNKIGNLYTYDFAIMNYLANRCKEEANDS